ncbi:MAG: phosphatidylglycerol lysyltransferase domain-containing protein [Angelakisella sp.]
MTAAGLAAALAGEYRLPVTRLITLTGSRMRNKRSQLRQFETACPGWRFEPLDKANIDLAFGLERLWQTDPAADKAQLELVRDSFRLLAQGRLPGGILRDNHREYGYAITTPPTTEAIILVLRSLPVPAGSAAMVYRETAKLLLTGCPTLGSINLGNLGGRQEQLLRQSYCPKQTCEK